MAYLVQTKAQWQEDEFWRERRRATAIFLRTEEEAEADTIRRNAEWLLEHLYTPYVSIGCVRSEQGARLPSKQRLALSGERINWGDLGVASCVREGDLWAIALEEASADSENLCRYVHEWLLAWGWPNRVTAHW